MASSANASAIFLFHLSPPSLVHVCKFHLCVGIIHFQTFKAHEFPPFFRREALTLFRSLVAAVRRSTFRLSTFITQQITYWLRGNPAIQRQFYWN